MSSEADDRARRAGCKCPLCLPDIKVTITMKSEVTAGFKAAVASGTNYSDAFGDSAVAAWRKQWEALDPGTQRAMLENGRRLVAEHAADRPGPRSGQWLYDQLRDY